MSDYTVSDDRFTVDMATGKLYVVAGSDFDYETDGDTLSLTITASAGNGTDTSSGSVTVTLTLTNDPNELFFDATTYTNTLPENEGSYSFAAITASDANDPTRNISYSLSGADTTGFTIDDRGVITYSGDGFDFETDTGPTLTVVATSGDDSTSTPVTIQLTNDPNELFFDAAPHTRMLDENETSANFDAVVASDANDPTRNISYTLFDENKQTQNPLGFTIDGNGVISYSGTGFDFETDSNITLTVVATNGDDRAETKVTIQLTDVDETPTNPTDPGNGNNNGGGSTVTDPEIVLMFDEGNDYSLELDENTTGGEVGTITARDNNNASRTDITYALGGADASSFRIDPNSGAITYIGAALNYEAATKKSFALTVTASAGGESIESQSVTITLNDVNDAPEAVFGARTDFGEIERPDVPTVPTARPTEELDLSGLFMDEDGDNLTLALAGTPPTGISLSGTSLTIAENTSVGTYSLTLSASDGKGGVSAQRDITFTITPHVIEEVLDKREDANILHGTPYEDYQKGHGGDDTLYGGPDADILDGGDGDDTANYGDSEGAVIIDLSAVQSDDYVHSASTDPNSRAYGDRLKGIENIFGSEYNDVLTGDGKSNELSGGDGNDTLIGGGGDDTLISGIGQDILTGGAGADEFNLNSDGTGDDLSQANVIMDFTRGDDLLHYTGSPISAIWYERGVNANVGTADTDTVIYLDADKSNIFVILADYDDDITNEDFVFIHVLHTYTITEIVTSPAANIITGEVAGETLTGTEDAADIFVIPSAAGYVISGFAPDAANPADGDLITLPDSTSAIWWAYGSTSGNTYLYGAQNGTQPLAVLEGFSDDITAALFTNSGITVNTPALSITEGTDGPDTLLGDTGPDIIYGLADDDYLTGVDGNDTLYGGAGEDTLESGIGDDTLFGGYDNVRDKLNGDAGADDYILHYSDSHNNADLIQVNSETTAFLPEDGDRLILPEGVDEIWVATSSGNLTAILTGLEDEDDNGYSYLALIRDFDSDDLEVWNGTTGNVVFTNESGTGEIHKLDEYATGNGNNSASLIIANTSAYDGNGGDDVIRDGGGDNLIIGNDGNDVIHGGAGNDDISAGTGNDWMHGGTGNDWMHGGTGADTFTGGDGEDTFVLEVKGAASLMTADVITDFTSGTDELTFFTATNGKDLWYERGVDAVSAGNPDAGTGGANDTVIYGDEAKTDIIVILADYNGDLSPDDFEIPGYVGTILEIS